MKAVAHPPHPTHSAPTGRPCRAQQTARAGTPSQALVQLQRTAGNQAVLDLIGLGHRGGYVQRAPNPASAEAPERTGGLAAGLATALLSYLSSSDLGTAAVRGLIAMGVSSENDLTNLLFWAHHPELALQKIPPNEAELAGHWVRLRDLVVRPVLAASGPGGGSREPTPSEPGGPASSPAGIGAEQLGEYRNATATRFRREVYEAQLQRNLRRKKEFFPGLPPAQLAVVEEGHKLHVDAATDARDLLAAARADLAAQQKAGDTDALKVTRIGIASAYRDPTRDFAAWRNAFNTHYNDTAIEREGLKGGAHGPAAVRLMVERMVVKKAVPGFSNHTKGLAIDFSTRQGKVTFGASSAQRKGWVNTWLYRWLETNAGTHHFKPYSQEEWHWDHQV